MASPLDGSLRIRLYIAGQLKDETWLRPGDTDTEDMGVAVGRLHAEMCEAAEQAGQTWAIEVYDPEDDDGLSFGTELVQHE
jgi:hypothetical protein